MASGMRGVSAAVTVSGPPERITPRGANSRDERFRGCVKRVDLAVHAGLPNAPGDQLRVLRTKVDDQQTLIVNIRLPSIERSCQLSG